MQRGRASGRSFWLRRHRPSASEIWRFPYLAAKYGGGMFLFTYLVLVLTFGVSAATRNCAWSQDAPASIGAFRHFGAEVHLHWRARGGRAVHHHAVLLHHWRLGHQVHRELRHGGSGALADGGDFFAASSAATPRASCSCSSSWRSSSLSSRLACKRASRRPISS